MRAYILVLALAQVLGACGKSKEKEGESAKASGEGVQKGYEISPPLPEDFSAFGLDGIKGKWQGAWVVPSQGRLVAWEVSGDKVQVSDGSKDSEHQFVVMSPCQVGVVIQSKHGHGVNLMNFAMDGDTLYAGIASGAGYRDGDRMAACTTDGVWLKTAEGCVLWKQELGEGEMVWAKEAAECGTITKEGYGDFVTMKAESVFQPRELKIEGNALLSDLRKLEKLADFAAAKAALTAE